MGRTSERKHGRKRRASGLANAIFTMTQQRVLGLFFGDPGRSFIKQELIESTGSGSGAVQRELARLIESGLVTITMLGRQKRYQANRSTPIFEELRSIVAKTAEGERAEVQRDAPMRWTVSAQEPEWQLIFD